MAGGSHGAAGGSSGSCRGKQGAFEGHAGCLPTKQQPTLPELEVYVQAPYCALWFGVRNKIYHGGGDMKKQLLRLWREEEGQDLTEYGMLLLFIALVSIAVVQGLGSIISDVFSNASSSMS